MSERIRDLFRGRRGAVLSVAIVVWALALFDLTLLPRKGEPYLPALASEQLLGVRVAGDARVLTAADATSPRGPWVLERAGAGLRVVGTQLPRVPQGTETHYFRAPFRTVIPRFAGEPVDIDPWGAAGPAVFSISSARRHPRLTIYPVRDPSRRLFTGAVPLPPQTTDRREFFVARWSGKLPDLFVVDHNRRRRRPKSKPSWQRWVIRIYSGESGFKRVLLHTMIRRKLSRRLSAYAYTLDVGPLHRSRPNLFFVSKERRTGTGRVEIHMISAGSHLRNFTLHAPTVLPQRLGYRRMYAFQPRRRGGGAMLAVKIEDGRLSLRRIPLP
jgi:hypothetical protein